MRVRRFHVCARNSKLEQSKARIYISEKTIPNFARQANPPFDLDINTRITKSGAIDLDLWPTLSVRRELFLKSFALTRRHIVGMSRTAERVTSTFDPPPLSDVDVPYTADGCYPGREFTSMGKFFGAGQAGRLSIGR